MEKEELIKDLLSLQIQHQKIIGAIEYIATKIRELEKLERLKDIPEKLPENISKDKV